MGDGEDTRTSKTEPVQAVQGVQRDRSNPTVWNHREFIDAVILAQTIRLAVAHLMGMAWSLRLFSVRDVTVSGGSRYGFLFSVGSTCDDER